MLAHTTARGGCLSLLLVAVGAVSLCATARAASLPAPELLSPAREARDVPRSPTFSWSPVPGALGYRIVVAARAAELPAEPDAWWCSKCPVNAIVPRKQTSYSPRRLGLRHLRATTTYYWTVHALGEGPPYGVWAAPARFVTEAGSPTPAPTAAMTPAPTPSPSRQPVETPTPVATSTAALRPTATVAPPGGLVRRVRIDFAKPEFESEGYVWLEAAGLMAVAAILVVLVFAASLGLKRWLAPETPLLRVWLAIGLATVAIVVLFALFLYLWTRPPDVAHLATLPGTPVAGGGETSGEGAAVLLRLAEAVETLMTRAELWLLSLALALGLLIAWAATRPARERWLQGTRRRAFARALLADEIRGRWRAGLRRRLGPTLSDEDVGVALRRFAESPLQPDDLPVLHGLASGLESNDWLDEDDLLEIVRCAQLYREIIRLQDDARRRLEEMQRRRTELAQSVRWETDLDEALAREFSDALDALRHRIHKQVLELDERLSALLTKLEGSPPVG